MARPSITKTVADAYQALFSHLNDWFGIAIVPVAVVSSMGVAQLYIGGALGGAAGLVTGLVMQVVGAAFSACVYIAWIRAVHGRFSAVQPVSPLKPTPTEKKFLISAVLLMVVPAILIVLIVGTSLTVGGAEGDMSALGMQPSGAFLTLLISIAVLFVSVRLAFYFVDLALGTDREPMAAFGETKELARGIFLAVLLALVPVGITLMFLSSIILGLFGPTMAAIIIIQVVSSFINAFGAALTAAIAVTYYQASRSGR